MSSDAIFPEMVQCWCTQILVEDVNTAVEHAILNLRAIKMPGPQGTKGALVELGDKSRILFLPKKDFPEDPDICTLYCTQNLDDAVHALQDLGISTGEVFTDCPWVQRFTSFQSTSLLPAFLFELKAEFYPEEFLPEK